MAEIIDRLRANLSDRYTIDRELGQGGMATVFLATDVRHEREVAIKVLNPELSASIGGERFEREIKLAAKLQHPHILGLFDSGSADGLLFYVMPFVKGESVRDRIDKEGQLPVDDAVQITLEVADALGYAHSQGIIHRDIKPENILLANGHALVADFGIARAATEGSQKLTATGVAIGTPAYMSPEQSSGEAVGPTADIYSLGCVLYEMLAGEPPFTGKNSMAIMARHAMDTLPSIRIVRPAVPEEVEEAIFAAMEKSPVDRPKTAADFSAIMGVPLGATATRRVNTTPRFTATRRVPTGARAAVDFAPAWWRRPWVIPVAIVLVAAVSFGSWKLATGGRRGIGGVAVDSLAKRVAVLYFADNSKDASLRAEADGLTEALIRSLEQVSALRVVSRNGVSKYRDENIPKDSVARALSAGTLVVGSIEPDSKNRVRISTRLVDGNGTDLGRKTSVTVARDSLFSASDVVAGDVSRSLRLLLGTEIQLKESQAGTKSMPAWTQLNKAEKARKDADSLFFIDPARSAALFVLADSILQVAQSADKDWIDPVILEGEVVYQRGRLEKNSVEHARWNDSAAKIAARALAKDPASARALALRGTITYSQWKLAVATDPVARAKQLDDALKDLETAVQRDPSLGSAYAMLAFLYYDKKDVPSSLSQARKAYEADAFLSNTSNILQRLFFASHDTEQWGEATKWCDEGARRFPADFNFTICKLFLLLTPDAKPDIPAAWRLAAKVDSLAPPTIKAFQSHKAQVLVGGVIGRAGKALGPGGKSLIDSANKVLVRARADRTVDPKQELLGYEAVSRTQMGDYDEAIRELKQYVNLNPDHSFMMGGNVHWWWRELKPMPAFAPLLSRGK